MADNETEKTEEAPLKLGRRGTRSDGLHVHLYENREVDENGVMWVKSRCWGCHCNCGMLVGVDQSDGTITEIRPNEEQDTVLCERVGEGGIRMIKFHYHKDRVNYALKRKPGTERGAGEWEQIPYEQALDEIADKLDKLRKEYGAKTLAIAEGTYRSGYKWARSRFANLYGSANCLDPGQICWTWIYAINLCICGFQIELSLPPTIFYSECIVQWGINPNQKYGPNAPAWRLYEQVLAKAERPRIIVVDPEGIEMTRHADHWLQVRPGTDLSVMIAWINVILAEGLYDEAFLKNWTNAPFLIDAETKKLLRADDLSLAVDGDHGNFIAWDTVKGEPVVWISDECRYERDGVEVDLWGDDYEVTLADGSKTKAKTALKEVWDRIRENTPYVASQISGIPERKIVEAARCYAENTPGVIVWGIGGGDQEGYNATGCAISKTLLRAITGNVDVLGGEYVGEPGPVMANGMFPLRDSELELAMKVTPEERKNLLGGDSNPIVGWQGFEPCDECFQKMWRIPRPQLNQLLANAPVGFRAMITGEPYPVKALIAWSSNPMMWMGDTHMVHKALKSLDLLVVVDYWITPTAALADYIMPAADWMERPTCTTSEDTADFMVLGDRAVVPEGDRHTDYDFFRGLGIRLGQEEWWPWPTAEDAAEYRVARVGLSYEEAINEGALFSEMRFNKHEEILPNGQYRGFATVSKRLELYSSIIQDLGFDPIPEYKELPETIQSDPEMAKEYPITCTTGGRFIPMFHSEFRQLGLGTREMWPWPYFTINRRTAQDLGIRDGDWCWIENERGRIRQRAKLTTSIGPDVITVQASWWYPELPMTEPSLGGAFESNANVLTNSDPKTMDPACGCWYNRGFLVKVYPCNEPFPSENIVPKVPIEDTLPPHIPAGNRGLTPIGPVREDNYGPYGPEYGTCPDTPLEWAIHENK